MADSSMPEGRDVVSAEPITYDGAECLSGACALCNSEHPGPPAAVAELDAFFSFTRTESHCDACAANALSRALVSQAR